MSYQAFIGKSERRQDTVWPLLARALAATLNVAAPDGEHLPPLWHWTIFQEWAPARALGADGHPQRDGFLPAAPALPRRMWAGGRLQFYHPLRIGEQVSRDSTVTAVEEKTGSTGPLLFVTVRHTISDSGGVALIEEQDLVYRGAQGVSAAADQASAPVANSVSTNVVIDPPLLFRYSAVTGNAHRIHYDQNYAANEEGYASLVVHGPLQATLLAGFALRQRAGGTLAEFSFRGRRPALLHRCPLTLEAWPEGKSLRLRSLDSERVVCTTAEAKFIS
jgi:hydroxyacyl-ACP dehydratase HTD2-like protein with hotdog domain